MTSNNTVYAFLILCISTVAHPTVPDPKKQFVQKLERSLSDEKIAAIHVVYCALPPKDRDYLWKKGLESFKQSCPEVNAQKLSEGKQLKIFRSTILTKIKGL